MQILYKSTRGKEQQVTASQAVLNGLAGDGGLYVPDHFPKLEVPLEALAEMDYRETAWEVMRLFLTDYTEEELKGCIERAYDSKFDVPEIAPLRQAGDVWFLELFHGRTIAFKDMALSILPHLLTTAASKNGVSEKIVILTATSGDTGKAALAGFADVPGTEIIVFYPKDGVSPVQERQMVTQKGDNTHVIAIRGNFDDAQTGVKNIFGDAALAKKLHGAGIRFSSANSINIGRLVPQAAYYVYAYASLLKKGVLKAGDPVDFTVPTGNFGNILAAWYAKQIGLPVGKLVCASNENKVLFDFFRTGIYDRNRPFILTSSPSMDILVSSNLERLLYHISGQDTEKTAALMKALSDGGRYEISAEMRAQLDDFCGKYAAEEEVFAAIRKIWEEHSYVTDPHTAVAAACCEKYREEAEDPAPMVIASTASPYKFGRNVLHAIDPARFDGLTDDQQFDALHELSGTAIPPAIEEIRSAEIRHREVVDTDGMEEAVKRILRVK